VNNLTTKVLSTKVISFKQEETQKQKLANSQGEIFLKLNGSSR